MIWGRKKDDDYDDEYDEDEEEGNPLETIGILAIVAGVAALIWLGPAAAGGALAGMGTKMALKGGGMVLDDSLD